MFLASLASAFPQCKMTQPEVWEILSHSPAMDMVSRRGARILETVLLGDSGIETRHFAVEPPVLFSLDAQQLNEAFEREAPKLAHAALAPALEQASLPPEAIDALFLSTCTGYLCPGVTSHLAERADLRSDTFLHDVTGLGCGAAVPTMHAADCFLKAHPDATVATVSVEICSAAFFLCDDPGVLVSACLFGDGAAAAVWKGRGENLEWEAGNFHSYHVPSERERIRFVNHEGRLRNKLDKAVPEVAAAAVETLFEKSATGPDQIIAHCGGRDVIDAIESRLPKFSLRETRNAMRQYGNMSSPSVMVSLQDRLGQENPSDKKLWITGFGAGFAAYACELTRS